MILTGCEIEAMRQAGHIVIEPYDARYIEPNSYGFHLGEKLLRLDGDVVDPTISTPTTEIAIPEIGYVLQPGAFYLGHTVERIGGVRVSAELFANHSTAAMGMWVQTSAPLGHVGAVINWTLEICTTQAIRVYPRMRIGKICFWQNFGHIDTYAGRYSGSQSVVASKAFLDPS
ncbi:deoxycytidine triphosphate deaminase [Variovorax sp. PBL-H6]|uniref:dCTP deaminase n=1 Tax=Variovorax sp. PBL-H6 TaxID=434009 RepID=UPI001318204F|nr:deoxycytidine triphosphate deaminase [Variovorax sp. PBL-H6]VTU34515.1 deoxycytidine triphosphate deaminase [Variovorax sp. PBL-H6]